MFVTGATGFLGRHLVPASEAGEWDLFTPSSRTLDVRDRSRVIEEVTAWKPNVVVHLAYRRNERRTIVEGSRNVATAAAACGAHLIHLSTDVVFAGRALPYTETDIPDATMNYGRWKAAAEVEVATACPTAMIVRTSLLYGGDRLGTPQRDVEDVLAGRSHMRFFTDEFRCATHAADVATALVTLADRPDITGPLHVAAPHAISRADLANTFAHRLGGPDARVPTSSLAESGLDRPGRLVLDVSRAAALGIFCRDVHDAW